MAHLARASRLCGIYGGHAEMQVRSAQRQGLPQHAIHGRAVERSRRTI